MYKITQSNTNRPHSKSQTFENQLKINEHISLIILNSLCYRLIDLGDLTLFIQVDSMKKKNQALKTTQNYYV